MKLFGLHNQLSEIRRTLTDRFHVTHQLCKTGIKDAGRVATTEA